MENGLGCMKKITIWVACKKIWKLGAKGVILPGSQEHRPTTSLIEKGVAAVAMQICLPLRKKQGV